MLLLPRASALSRDHAEGPVDVAVGTTARQGKIQDLPWDILGRCVKPSDLQP